MTGMRNQNVRRIISGLLWSLLLQMAIAPSANSQTARR